MKLLSSLSSEQKEALGLLQIGTFLEYFDLMLFVHMAVLLNDLFFPKTDPHTASLLAAFAFCSTFIFRPIGAAIFGWMGDTIGRKSTIVLTTGIMSISCLLMANLPTYTQIGITATWVMIICRMAQGMSSMGEIVGAQIYVAESIRRPASYPAVAFVTISASIGTTAALGIATLVTSFYMNWRIAFWIGAVIAVVGSIARTRLRETPEFLELKRQQLKEGLAEANKDLSEDERHEDDGASGSSRTPIRSWKNMVDFKTLLSYFSISCGWPMFLYLGYMYFNPILKEDYGYSSSDIIRHNLLLSIYFLIPIISLAFLSARVHPLKILKFRGSLTLLLMIALPFLILNLDSAFHVFMLQAMIFLLTLDSVPAEAVFIYYLPIYKRFTLASFLFALSRALMYVITTFGMVFLGSYFGPYGLWFITIPMTFAYLYGVRHFEKLEDRAGNLTLSPTFKTSYRGEDIVKDTP
jgi:MHS family proline/betaine transporter-like MFS transporter